MELLGIDVSHHQHEIDWAKVAAAGIRFCFAKATEGLTFRDPCFNRNWRGMRDAGLYRGAYHFAHPGYSPEAQAALFHSVVGPLEDNDLPPVLDLEVSDGQSRDHVIDWTLRFVAQTEALFGRPVMLYTGGFWRFQLGDPELPQLSARPLWYAAYRMLPPPKLKTWMTWTFWQYAEDDPGHPVPGIIGRCDRDRFVGDEAKLQALTLLRLPPIDVTLQPPAASTPVWPGVYLVWPTPLALPQSCVHLVQARLVALGYQPSTTGVYDERTSRACREFQRDHGLVSDGIVGPVSWRALFTA